MFIQQFSFRHNTAHTLSSSEVAEARIQDEIENMFIFRTDNPILAQLSVGAKPREWPAPVLGVLANKRCADIFSKAQDCTRADAEIPIHTHTHSGTSTRNACVR